jgi:proline dehydrogenase
MLMAFLQGMGDVLGCDYLQRRKSLISKANEGKHVIVPKFYKCLTWGTVRECMQYLFRRAVENSGGTDRMRDGMQAYSAELRRRFLRW